MMNRARPAAVHGARRCGIAAIAVALALGACSDSTRPGGGGVDPNAEKLRAGLVVSGPLNGLYGPSGSGTTSDSEVVYVSMPPGSLAGGDSVRLRSAKAAGASVSASMGSGGFDPVEVFASPDDSLDVSVYTHGATTIARLRVPATRQPTVIRTTPARGRTDVPLNQGVIIVFSQPLDARTVTSSSIQLVTGGIAVPATVSVDAGKPWVVRLEPLTALKASTTYDIVVATTVTDIDGTPLTAPLSSTFVTGTAQVAVASIIVSALNQRGYTQGSLATAVPGGKAEFVADKISANGDTLTSRTGPYVWSSSDPSVATVLNTTEYDDTVTAVAAGEATISACAGTICGRGTIAVNAPEPGIVPTMLGDLGGGFSRVEAMSGGNVVGNALVAHPNGGYISNHAFLWTAALGMEDLGTLPQDRESYALAVNASGIVVGIGWDTLTGRPDYWIWQHDTGIKPLPLPDSAHDWSPFAIDTRGEIAYADTSSEIGLWSAAGGGSVVTLPRKTFPAGVNDRGQVVLETGVDQQCDSSNSCLAPCGTVAYVWNFETRSTVSTLAPRDSVTGEALAICPWGLNNQGVVSGFVMRNARYTETIGIVGRAFRWTPSGGFSYIPGLAVGTGSEGVRLNDAGDETVYLFSWQHAGQDSVYDLRSAAWLANGTVVSLGSLGGLHTAANGINDAQLVSGHSQVGSNTGQQQAVIWDLSTASPSRARAPSPPVAARTRAPLAGGPPASSFARGVPSGGRALLAHRVRTPQATQ